MKTVKEYLLSVDRDGLLDTYLHDYPIPLFAVSCFKTTLPEAMAKLRSKVNEFIEHITSLESVKTVDCVLFVHELYGDSAPPVKTSLCSIKEIMQKEVPEPYGLVPTDWSGCLACYISEDKLTQVNIHHLLSELIHQVTLFGWTEEEVTEELNYIEEALRKSEKDASEEKVNCRPFVEIARAYGWPTPEEEEEKEALERAVDDAKMEYERYCYIKAAKRVRKLLAESGKE